MSITRRLATTNSARQKALNIALNVQTHLPPGTVILNPATNTRLLADAPLYNTALTAVGNAQAAFSHNTHLKDAAVDNCRLYTSHFLQVFNLGVRRNKYDADQRAYYLLDINSDALPDLDSESDALLWMERVLTGEPNRIAAGGAPMANPDITEVQAQATVLGPLYVAQTNLKVTLNAAQESVDALNIEVDKLIKRLWDEVEAYYSEQTIESKRNYCRSWGVVYVTEGVPATLSGLVRNPTGAVAEGAVVTIDDTGATATTNHEGRYTINTTILGDITLSAALGALKGSQPVNIPDHTDGINVNVPDIVLV